MDFDLRLVNKGANRIDKLQVVNRGTETAYDVHLDVPEGAGLSLVRNGSPIAKIPGGGKAVTIDAMNLTRTMGGPSQDTAFDITITARTESGETVTQQVFLDMNG